MTIGKAPLAISTRWLLVFAIGCAVTRTPTTDSRAGASTASMPVSAAVSSIAPSAPASQSLPEPSPSVVDSGTLVKWDQVGTDPCHVLAIGDSLTDPKSHGGGYLNAWRRHCPNCQFTNLGRGGDMVNQMLGRLRRHLSETGINYSHLVIFGGVNDLYSDQTANRTLAKIEGDLSAMYQLGRARARVVIALTVAPWGGFHRWFTEPRGENTRRLNEWITSVKQQGEIDYVLDTGPLLTCGEPMRLCAEVMPPFHDGLHFGTEGHRRLGEALVGLLDGDVCSAHRNMRPSAEP
jgi:lysophospholipase L1-like esterase